MTSTEHQRLVNVLARELKRRYPGIVITGIDMRGTPKMFDVEYRNLPPPKTHNGRVPDLEGMHAGVKHLGEAETDMSAENLNDQLRAFSSRTRNDPMTHVLLHVIVPENIRSQMEAHIDNLKPGSRFGVDRQIGVWPMPI